MNADFIQGNILCKAGLPVIEDWERLQWNVDRDPPIEDERFSNDLPDAALYGWREAKHFAWRPKPEPVERNTNEWAEQEWKKIAAEDKRVAEMDYWESL